MQRIVPCQHFARKRCAIGQECSFLHLKLSPEEARNIDSTARKYIEKIRTYDSALQSYLTGSVYQVHRIDELPNYELLDEAFAVLDVQRFEMQRPNVSSLQDGLKKRKEESETCCSEESSDTNSILSLADSLPFDHAISSLHLTPTLPLMTEGMPERSDAISEESLYGPPPSEPLPPVPAHHSDADSSTDTMPPSIESMPGPTMSYDIACPVNTQSADYLAYQQYLMAQNAQYEKHAQKASYQMSAMGAIGMGYIPLGHMWNVFQPFQPVQPAFNQIEAALRASTGNF